DPLTHGGRRAGRAGGPESTGRSDCAPSLASGAILSPMTPETPPAPALVAPTPLAPLLARLRSGDLSLTDHVEALCARLEETEPYVRAFLPEQDRHQRLLEEARALEERFPDPAGRPPLFGAPVAVKDIIAVDGFETRAGSALPPELLAMPQASAVTRLREAGALVVGKSVTTEFAYMDAGATANPHDPGHTPGGSS